MMGQHLQIWLKVKKTDASIKALGQIDELNSYCIILSDKNVILYYEKFI